MPTHSELMEAMYLKRLFDALKHKSSRILKRQVAPEAKRAGIQPIDASWSAKCNQVHVNALFRYVKEMKHQ